MNSTFFRQIRAMSSSIIHRSTPTDRQVPTDVDFKKIERKIIRSLSFSHTKLVRYVSWRRHHHQPLQIDGKMGKTHCLIIENVINRKTLVLSKLLNYSKTLKRFIFAFDRSHTAPPTDNRQTIAFWAWMYALACSLRGNYRRKWIFDFSSWEATMLDLGRLFILPTTICRGQQQSVEEFSQLSLDFEHRRITNFVTWLTRTD